MKHSNVFYKRNKDNQFEPVKDAKAIRNKAGLDLYRIGFNICEGKTGRILQFEDNMDQLKTYVAKLETNADLLERCKRVINAAVEKDGLSPRYTRPDEKYADLFPSAPSESKGILAPTVDGQKHYFSEVHNQDGIALYIMKNKSDPWDYLYLHYEGWMLAIGNLMHKDSRIEEYTKEMPDFRQIMTTHIDAALADPNKWADMGAANFLGRYEEADAHNQHLREMRSAERQAEQEERARKAEEERLQELREYEATVFDAEQSILNKRELIDDKDLRGTSLILQLFRLNGIDVPLKTQGWIKSALYRVYPNERDGWNYSYYRNHKESQSFNGYFDKLVAAVERKYEQTPETDNMSEPEREHDTEI